MGYYIDLQKISLDDYRLKLGSAYLPPGRRILKENLDERFGCFRNLGIGTVKELIQALKRKDRLKEFQKIDCFQGDYLVILLRELNSMLPKPNRIAGFAGIPADTVARLEKIGITNTEKLYGRVLTKSGRLDLARSTGISEAVILELTKLTDLSRIKWVGVTFARMLCDSGIDTVKKASEADPVQLHATINQLNKDQGIYKGQIGLNDMKIFVNAAKDVPQEIEYQ